MNEDLLHGVKELVTMSMRPLPSPPVPSATAALARAVFPAGCLAMRLRDELGEVFSNTDFVAAYPRHGGPALSPATLALVSVLQYAERLTDRQAANAAAARIDWKYTLGFELADPGFDHSVLSQFRDRLIEHGLESCVLELVLDRCAELGLLRTGGRVRTDATHVVACARALNRLEFVTETMRAALEALAVAAPEWLTGHGLASEAWQKRYGARADYWRLPKGETERAAFAQVVGVDGFALLDAVAAEADRKDGLPWLAGIPAVAFAAACLGTAVCARRPARGAAAHRQGVAARRGPDRVPLRSGRPRRDQTLDPLGRLKAAPDRNRRCRRIHPAPDHTRRHHHRAGR